MMAHPRQRARQVGYGAPQGEAGAAERVPADLGGGAALRSLHRQQEGIFHKFPMGFILFGFCIENEMHPNQIRFLFSDFMI